MLNGSGASCAPDSPPNAKIAPEGLQGRLAFIIALTLFDVFLPSTITRILQPIQNPELAV
jgi:hypothetical protein